jgi:ComF family protein
MILPNEPICPVCEKPAIGGVTHPRCRGLYTLDGLTSFFRYDGVVKNAIKQIKYQFVSDLTKEFIGLIPLTSYNIIRLRIGSRPTILVPIPLHISRERFRGFNQAELLGLQISQNLDFPVESEILKRTKPTIPQVEMKNRQARLTNMNSVFAVNHSKIQHYTDSAMILFDDVFTTGATMRAAANVLKRAGVQFVWAVTLAR